MTSSASPPRRIWITLEGQEVIELKQAMLDHDAQSAVEFFWRVIVPRVQEAAQRRGLSLEEAQDEHGRLPG